ncbi:NAD(P)-binding protein [Dentipellis sp. KUC8613]|nr:NAD(P)-binding protein [Dentipellis sp. KUC8613]
MPVALITGAAQGIGRAIALRLADDGFDVAVNDLGSKSFELERLVAEITEKGRKACAVPADVTQEDEVKKMVEDTVDRLGSLDVVSRYSDSLMSNVPSSNEDVKVEDFDRIYAINVRGPMLCYKYAGIQMIAQGRGGRIIGKSTALYIPFPVGSAYCASKHAVRGLTQVAAAELGKHNITVNAYAPGFTPTPLCESGHLHWEILNKIYQILEKLSISRSGEPEEIAALVSFLASEKAGYITGQTISCDGGLCPS